MLARCAAASAEHGNTGIEHLTYKSDKLIGRTIVNGLAVNYLRHTGIGLGYERNARKLAQALEMHKHLLRTGRAVKAESAYAHALHGKVLSVTSELEDSLADALDSDDAMIAIRLSGWGDVDVFADCQYMINKPLCIVCDDADVLESALRVYQGRALYEGALDESALLPLCDKYGLII